MQKMPEMWVHSLSQQDPLEQEMEAHFSIIAQIIPWTEEPGGLQYTGWQRAGHDLVIEHGNMQVQDTVLGTETTYVTGIDNNLFLLGTYFQ